MSHWSLWSPCPESRSSRGTPIRQEEVARTAQLRSRAARSCVASDPLCSAQFELAVAGRSTHHWATADVASEPEDQQNNQHKTEQSAAVVWCAPPGTAAVVVATASAKEQHQDDNDDDQRHDGTCLLSSSRVGVAPAKRMRTGTRSACYPANGVAPIYAFSWGKHVASVARCLCSWEHSAGS